MNNKPTLIFDGDCNFCRLWIERWKALTGDRITYAPYQEVASQYPEIPVESFRRTVQLVEPGGKVSSAANAVFRALCYASGKGWMLKLYDRLPVFASISEWFYGVVAAHRDFFYRLTRFFWGKDVLPSTYVVSSWLFFRCLAVIFFIAFVSLWTQIIGLVGSRGILPATNFLEAVRGVTQMNRYWLVPTVCWLNSSDAFLNFSCATGAFLSVLLFFGIFPRLLLFLLWALYLSLSTVCRDFLAFQWDILLLEIAFLAIFLAPNGALTWRCNPPRSSRIIFWLLGWLLFRLMFSSGIVKLLSGDANWRNLTALKYHYETQPLPTWIGWYAHQLPSWFQKLSVLLVFFCESLVPFFIFMPRRIRRLACYTLMIFQTLIFLTGNYCFFNLLTVALCILLIDDRAWPNSLKNKCPSKVTPESSTTGRWIIKPVAIVLFLLSIVQMSITLGEQSKIPDALMRIVELIEPYRTVNRYGLFAVMTTTRPEIQIEGSQDGEHWFAYRFKYKAGDLNQKPEFVEPHQPRLDWQMWFAALESYSSNEWFVPFCQRLLEGSPDVTSLLATNPFPSKPPHYLRAVVYQYHFTSLEEKRSTGNWWKRELEGPYSPVFSLRQR